MGVDDKLASIIAIAVFVAIAIAVIYINSGKVNDPNNDEYIQTNQVPIITKLIGTEFKVSFYRQSGNEYKAPVLIQPLSAAIDAAMSTLNRAKIDELRVYENTENLFVVERLLHSHKGASEGKKMGRVVIKRILNDQQESIISKAQGHTESLNVNLAIANTPTETLLNRNNALYIAKQSYSDILPILDQAKFIKAEALAAVKESIESVEKELIALNEKKEA